MSCCSISFQALPPLSPHPTRRIRTQTQTQTRTQTRTQLTILSKKTPFYNTNLDKQKGTSNCRKSDDCVPVTKSSLAIPLGLLLSTVEQPALALTGVNDEEDLIWVLIQFGIVAFWYFLVIPPILMNWLRIRWYKRGLFEMYLQFMSIFIFFPGILLWAPFLNFRKFPRDPSMKYPWSTPEDPSKVKNAYRKYPWATLEDYEV